MVLPTILAVWSLEEWAVFSVALHITCGVKLVKWAKYILSPTVFIHKSTGVNIQNAQMCSHQSVFSSNIFILALGRAVMRNYILHELYQEHMSCPWGGSLCSCCAFPSVHTSKFAARVFTKMRWKWQLILAWVLLLLILLPFNFLVWLCYG